MSNDWTYDDDLVADKGEVFSVCHFWQFYPNTNPRSHII
jgi:hypothetical protein